MSQKKGCRLRFPRAKAWSILPMSLIALTMNLICRIGSRGGNGNSCLYLPLRTYPSCHQLVMSRQRATRSSPTRYRWTRLTTLSRFVGHHRPHHQSGTNMASPSPTARRHRTKAWIRRTGITLASTLPPRRHRRLTFASPWCKMKGIGPVIRASRWGR